MTGRIWPLGVGVALWLCAAAALAQPTANAASTVTSSPPAQATGSGPFSLGAEALVWWLKDSPVPAPTLTDGLVGRPGTTVLLGGQDLGTGASGGLRISGTYAASDRSGFEANVFYLPKRSTSASVSSSGKLGSTDLIVPFVDALTSTESGTEISFAPIYAGSARQELSTSLLGAELNGQWTLAASPGAARVDLLAGLRYLRLRETYTLTTSSPYLPPSPPDIWDTTDTFETTNAFYGAQAGLRAWFDQGAWFAAGTAKLALGGMAQNVDIGGSLVTNDFNNYGATQVFPGGYFALPTNIGSHSRTVFAAVPEVGLTAGYRLAPQATLVVGYSFLYASNVARPGRQINRTINTTQSTAHTEDPTPQLQGPAQPSFQFNDSNFWAQGVSLGLQVRF